jgi:hypothetical protein
MVDPSELQARGTVGLARFGLGGGFTAAKAATFSAALSAPSCAGRLTWRMHPATRAAVPDGNWTARFRGDQTERFTVQAGGRLATGLRLPRALVACNGVTGGVDLFIGPTGRAAFRGANLRAAMRFRGRSTTGTLDAGGRGCPGGPLRFTASGPRL